MTPVRRAGHGQAGGTLVVEVEVVEVEEVEVEVVEVEVVEVEVEGADVEVVEVDVVVGHGLVVVDPGEVVVAVRVVVFAVVVRPRPTAVATVPIERAGTGEVVATAGATDPAMVTATVVDEVVVVGGTPAPGTTPVRLGEAITCHVPDAPDEPAHRTPARTNRATPALAKATAGLSRILPTRAQIGITLPLPVHRAGEETGSVGNPLQPLRSRS